ncbi:hypothetical protein HY78_24265 [Rhizorhabdus wittichii DC-6]|nr:hypothetical protein HY78_24265 [Rhizorhabdus wittichii DC-6]
MLIKRGSPIAREAVFPAPEPAPVKQPEPVRPSENDLAVARLTRENETLRAEIADLRARWADELAAAERRAREAAARDHVRDDAQRLDVLVGALTAARQQFEAKLVSAVERSATDLAVLAMGKLFEVRANDAELLARVVTRRLGDLDEKTVVELQLAPADADGAVGEEITAMLPTGTRVVSDPTLRPGTARLQLRLGSAVIDPAAGFERLHALLAKGADDA